MSLSLDFHELLKKYRYESGFTQVDLAQALDTHQPVISNYERGRSTPTRDEILAIAKVLNLNDTQTNDLLRTINYSPIKDDNLDIDISEAISISGNVVKSWYSQPTSNTYRELNIQIQDLKDAISSLSDNFERNDSSNITKSSTNSEGLIAQVQDLQAAISELQATSKEITAPVALPTKQQLEVRLIPTTSFERLEEYRSEENKWFTWAGIFVGAILGLCINLITGGEATISTYIVAVTFLVMTILTGWSARNYSNRAKKLRDDIIDKKASSNQSVINK